MNSPGLRRQLVADYSTRVTVSCVPITRRGVLDAVVGQHGCGLRQRSMVKVL
jgi:hypothetical protein